MEGPGSSFIDDSEPLKVTKKRKLDKEEDKKQKPAESSQGKSEAKNEIFAPSLNLDSQYQYALGIFHLNNQKNENSYIDRKRKESFIEVS